MATDYRHKDLQKASFRNAQLVNHSFTGSDLRGADFSGANLTGADLKGVRTGIPSSTIALIFAIALIISLLSGYVAMLAGNTVQDLLKSGEPKLRAAGIVAAVVNLAFIAYYIWKGGRSVVMHLVAPIILISIVLGIVAIYTGLGTGRGMFIIALSLLLTVVMFAIGTVARTLAGVLSSTVIFAVVTVGGSIFGTKLGGSTGAVIMAASCAVISRKALNGEKGFDTLRKIATLITCSFGTSFKAASLKGADFSGSMIRNADFTDADLTAVDWGDAKKINCAPIQVNTLGDADTSIA